MPCTRKILNIFRSWATIIWTYLDLSLCHPSFYHPNLLCQWLDLSGSCLQSSQTLEGHPKLSAQEASLQAHHVLEVLDGPARIPQRYFFLKSCCYLKHTLLLLLLLLEQLQAPPVIAETWAQVNKNSHPSNLCFKIRNPSYFFRTSHIAWFHGTAFGVSSHFLVKAAG